MFSQASWKKAVLVAVFLMSMAVLAHAGFIDFEGGWDGIEIRSTIVGLEFTNTAGYDWVYGDWRTNGYNGKYPNYSIVNDWIWPRPLATQYYSDGNFFGWLGAEQGAGIITFTEAYATYFQIEYSTYSGVTLEAYDEWGVLLDRDDGVFNNTGTGAMGVLRVEAPGMAYVKMYGVNNQWLADNLETDALQDCTQDEHCDDGAYCNGVETCNLAFYQCEDGEAVVCEDDGLFCNGEEVCSNAQEDCVHTGNPCPAGQACHEETDTCGDVEDDDDDDDEDWLLPDDDEDDDDDDSVVFDAPKGEEDEDAGWPEGQVTGGCCA